MPAFATQSRSRRTSQRGVVAVEFALLMMFIMVPLLLFMFEIGRFMYLTNTMQEAVRRGARLAVVSWTSKSSEITAETLFGGSHLPAGAEVDAAVVQIDYLNAAGDVVASGSQPISPGDNMSACADAARATVCLYSVRVTLSGVNYQPLFLRFSSWGTLPMHDASVTMHAESLGFND